MILEYPSYGKVSLGFLLSLFDFTKYRISFLKLLYLVLEMQQWDDAGLLSNESILNREAAE